MVVVGVVVVVVVVVVVQSMQQAAIRSNRVRGQLGWSAVERMRGFACRRSRRERRRSNEKAPNRTIEWTTAGCCVSSCGKVVNSSLPKLAFKQRERVERARVPESAARAGTCKRERTRTRLAPHWLCGPHRELSRVASSALLSSMLTGREGVDRHHKQHSAKAGTKTRERPGCPAWQR